MLADNILKKKILRQYPVLHAYRVTVSINENSSSRNEALTML